MTAEAVRGSATRAGLWTYYFDVHTPQRVWHFSCEREEDRRLWVMKIGAAIRENQREQGGGQVGAGGRMRDVRNPLLMAGVGVGGGD